MNDYREGYPKLAVFQNSSEEFAIYRRFGYLGARLLLDKQDQLRLLECRLDEYDRANRLTATTRDLSADDIGPRQALLTKIEDMFNSYGTTFPWVRYLSNKPMLMAGSCNPHCFAAIVCHEQAHRIRISQCAQLYCSSGSDP